jgi:hypothetical protein
MRRLTLSKAATHLIHSNADEFVPLWSARQDKLSRPCAPLSADKSTKRISQAKVRDRQD